MSKLDELIKELCPNGVEYKELGEICDFQNGFAFKSSLFKESGEIILRITNIYNGIVNEEDLKYFSLDDYKENLENYIVSNNDIVIAMSGATTGKVGINNTDKKFYLNQRVGKFITHTTKLNNKFLYHFLLSKSLEILKISSGSGAQPNLSTESIKKLMTPVPPLKVQDEIVGILDNYTKSVEELKEKLNEELIARKKQYSWYRDYLLKFENKVEIVKLGSISELKSGGTPKTENLEYWENGNIPWMSSGEVNKGNIYETEKKITEKGYNNSSAKMLPKDTVVIALAGQGKTRGTVAITRIELCTNQSLCGIIPNEKLNSDFLYHYLKTQYENLRQLSSGDGTRGGLNLKMLNNYLIPLPPLEVQKRIVEVLDNFEKICKELNIELSSEIEIKQKEYEFVRNYLLTFEEKSRQAILACELA